MSLLFRFWTRVLATLAYRGCVGNEVLNQLTYCQLFGFSYHISTPFSLHLAWSQGMHAINVITYHPFSLHLAFLISQLGAFFFFHFYWAKLLDLSGIAKVGCGLATVGLSKTPGPWLIYKEQPHASVCNVWQYWAVLTGLIRLSLLEILDLTDPSPKCYYMYPTNLTTASWGVTRPLLHLTIKAQWLPRNFDLFHI